MVNLGFTSQRITLNFVPSCSATLELRTLSGEIIRIQKKEISPWPREEINKITRAYKILRVRSIQSRISFYLEQFKKFGFIDYQSELGLGNFGSNIRIHSNGIVEKGGKRMDLKIAGNKKLFQFGSSRGVDLMSSFNPYEILIPETGFGFFDRKISFIAYWDFDILSSILTELAQGKQF